MTTTTPLPTLLPLLFLLVLSALATPQAPLSPFYQGILLDNTPQQALDSVVLAANATTTPPPTPAALANNLFKRTGTTCPKSYSACAALGAPGLCCKRNTNCSVDQAGHVACCPTGAACTGTVGGATVSASATTTGTSEYGVSSTTATATDTDTDGASTQPFIVVASTTVATPNGGARAVVVPLGGVLGVLGALLF